MNEKQISAMRIAAIAFDCLAAHLKREPSYPTREDAIFDAEEQARVLRTLLAEPEAQPRTLASDLAEDR